MTYQCELFFFLLFIIIKLIYLFPIWIHAKTQKKELDECLHCSIRSLFDVVVARSLSFLSARQQITSLSLSLSLSLSSLLILFLLANVPCRSFCLLNIRANERESKV